MKSTVPAVKKVNDEILVSAQGPFWFFWFGGSGFGARAWQYFHGQQRNLFFEAHISLHFFHWLHQTADHKERRLKIKSLSSAPDSLPWDCLSELCCECWSEPGRLSPGASSGQELSQGSPGNCEHWSVEDNFLVTSISLTLSMRRPQRVPREGNMSRCRMTSSAWAEAGTPWCCNSSLNRNIKCIYKETKSTIDGDKPCLGFMPYAL